MGVTLVATLKATDLKNYCDLAKYSRYFTSLRRQGSVALDPNMFSGWSFLAPDPVIWSLDTTLSVIFFSSEIAHGCLGGLVS